MLLDEDFDERHCGITFKPSARTWSSAPLINLEPIAAEFWRHLRVDEGDDAV